MKPRPITPAERRILAAARRYERAVTKQHAAAEQYTRTYAVDEAVAWDIALTAQRHATANVLAAVRADRKGKVKR